MSLGIFSHNRRRGTGALGASAIPGDCWDKVGFKDCHAEQWRVANASCQSLIASDPSSFQSKFSSMDQCLEQVTDKLTFEKCVPQICPQKKTVTSGMSPAVRLALIAGGVVLAVKLLPVFLPSR